MKRPHGNGTPDQRRRKQRQREMNRQLRVWTPRRVAGWILVVLAVVMGITHWLAHLGWRPIPLAMGWQDLVLGYPAAGVLAVVGSIVITSRRPGSGRQNHR
ncbi:hypothetical protein ACF3NT_02755 [Naumannella halotolerans]|uniref:Uncharacterized protein n=1 Tax=Naumannella halotolerans TaxID=993414 RepID=A0A4R7J6Y3_9ACTN|nr:hypothetical protein [Naumannella halotolerans]TDT32985.1 hypothetical protein CLV29_0576 [Naumannella halotolerans]